MTSTTSRDRTIARGLIALGLATLVFGFALTFANAARPSSTPVGPLPAGPVSTTATARGQLVAVALPRAPRQTGLVWRIARPYNNNIVRQVSEADVRASVVLVFKVVGRGHTSLVFALTRGDGSAKADKSATYRIDAA
jgi:hypothetical protein